MHTTDMYAPQFCGASQAPSTHKAPLTHRAPVTHHRTVVRTCHWCAETKFPAGINLVQTVALNWLQIESLMALDLIIIPAVTALVRAAPLEVPWRLHLRLEVQHPSRPKRTNTPLLTKIWGLGN